MPSTNGAEGRPSLSGGIVALVVGVALLVAYFGWLRWLRGWGAGQALAVLSVAAFLLVWGGRLVFRARSRQSRPAGLRLGRKRFQLLRPGLVYVVMMVVLFVGSLLGHSNTLMLVFAMMVGPFVLNGWCTLTMLRGVRARRQVRDHVMAGEPLWTELELENTKWFFASWLLTARDQIRCEDESLQAEVLFVRVPAKSARRGRYRMRLLRRGRYTLGPLTVATRFPLGLVERGVRIDLPGEILVQPRVGRLTRHWRSRTFQPTESMQTVRVRPGLHDDEFHRLREHRPGDSLRRVHWRTTARRNELTVREYRQHRSHQYFVVVDLWQPVQPGEADRDRVELAVSFAASLCVDQLQMHRDAQLEVIVAGAEFHEWQGRPGPAGIESLLNELALVRAGSEPDLTRLQESVAERRRRDTGIVLVSTRERSVVAETLARSSAEAAPLLADAVTVSVEDDDVEALVQFEENGAP